MSGDRTGGDGLAAAALAVGIMFVCGIAAPEVVPPLATPAAIVLCPEASAGHTTHGTNRKGASWAVRCQGVPLEEQPGKLESMATNFLLWVPIAALMSVIFWVVRRLWRRRREAS